MTETRVFACVVCTKPVSDTDEFKTIKGPNEDRVHEECSFRVDASAIVGGIAAVYVPRCHHLACGKNADYRYTWPGLQEMGICDEHAPELRATIATSGHTIPVTPIGETADYSGLRCDQLGCNRDASHRYIWPGKQESGVCSDHVGKLQAVAVTAGHSISFDMV